MPATYHLTFWAEVILGNMALCSGRTSASNQTWPAAVVRERAFALPFLERVQDMYHCLSWIEFKTCVTAFPRESSRHVSLPFLERVQDMFISPFLERVQDMFISPFPRESSRHVHITFPRESSRHVHVTTVPATCLPLTVLTPATRA